MNWLLLTMPSDGFMAVLAQQFLQRAHSLEVEITGMNPIQCNCMYILISPYRARHCDATHECQAITHYQI